MDYQQYLSAINEASKDPNWSGATIDEAAWNKLTPQQQYDAMMGVAGTKDLGPGSWLKAGDTDAQAYTAKYGAPTGTLVYGYGDPTQFGKGAEAWAKDPSKILKLPDGRWVMDSANVDQTKYDALKNVDAHSGLDLTPLKGVLSVLTAGMAGNAFLGNSSLLDAITGNAATPAGTYGAEDVGLNMNNAFTGVPSGVAGTSEDIGLNLGSQFAPDLTGAGPGAALERPDLFSAVTNPASYTPYTGPSAPYTVMSGTGNFGPGAFDMGVNGAAPSAGIFDAAGNPLYESPGWFDRLTGALGSAGSKLMGALPALSMASKFLAPGGAKPVGPPGGLGFPGGGAAHSIMPQGGGSRGQAEIDPFTKWHPAPIKTLGDYLKGI